jgi:hypothetical protein
MTPAAAEDARRNFMVPIPHAATWQELNANLEAECRVRRLQLRSRFRCRVPTISSFRWK